MLIVIPRYKLETKSSCSEGHTNRQNQSYMKLSVIGLENGWGQVQIETGMASAWQLNRLGLQIQRRSISRARPSGLCTRFPNLMCSEMWARSQLATGSFTTRKSGHVSQLEQGAAQEERAPWHRVTRLRMTQHMVAVGFTLRCRLLQKHKQVDISGGKNSCDPGE